MSDTNNPNLDAMTVEELRDIWLKFRGNSRKTAAGLFLGKPEGYVKAMNALGRYAINKVTAMQCRERGDISTATMYEKIAERIYSELPPYAKW